MSSKILKLKLTLMSKVFSDDYDVSGIATLKTHCLLSMHTAILQKYLDNFDLSIKVIYIVGTLAFTVGESPEANTADCRPVCSHQVEEA